MVVNVPGNGTQKIRTTRFGNVAVTAPAPTEEQIARSVRVNYAVNAPVPFAMETVFSHWRLRPAGTVESEIDLI
jgi:hypothetical protein